jgi:hypothetical protein
MILKDKMQSQTKTTEKEITAPMKKTKKLRQIKSIIKVIFQRRIWSSIRFSDFHTVQTKASELGKAIFDLGHFD